ncbi:hypothetical protein ACP70R_002756 [Stipagrostis hirtigluma subsp. patula]
MATPQPPPPPCPSPRTSLVALVSDAFKVDGNQTLHPPAPAR